MNRADTNPDRPWVIGHRGASRDAPENTRTAFETALGYGIDGIEFDVQLTRDRVPVLYHDRTLYKINRRRKRICDYRLAELREMDFGGWHSNRFRGEPVLTLAAALETYSPRTRLLVEIKSRERDRRSGVSADLAHRVVDAIRERVPKDRLDRLLILSFDPEVLRRVHRAAPGLFILRLLEDPAPAALRLSRHVGGCGIPVSKLTREMTETLRKNGRRVMTYSCNTPKQAEKGLSSGVDIMISDRPGWLVTYLSRRGSGR